MYCYKKQWQFFIIIIEEEVHTEGIVYNVVPRIPPTKTDKNKQI